jgi:hypothetical protein
MLVANYIRRTEYLAADVEVIVLGTTSAAVGKLAFA